MSSPPISNREWWRDEVWARATAMVKDGFSNDEIEFSTGLTHSQINRIREQHAPSEWRPHYY